MASLSKQPNGRRTIQFVGSDGKRRSIRFGKISQRFGHFWKQPSNWSLTGPNL